VEGDSVTGFRDVQTSSGVTARASAPSTYAFPTFSDPSGTVRLVRILTGPYAGIYVSPHDPGVRYTPDG
jgi:hypothetical protein